MRKKDLGKAVRKPTVKADVFQFEIPDHRLFPARNGNFAVRNTGSSPGDVEPRGRDERDTTRTARRTKALDSCLIFLPLNQPT